MLKKKAKQKTRAGRRNARCRREGGGVALACETLRGYAGVCAGVCMQDFVRRSARRQGCGGFNRSAHSAVPTLMNGWEDDFRIGKVSKTHLFFVGMICPSARMTARWMERKHCLRYQHFCWVATDLVDYRK